MNSRGLPSILGREKVWFGSWKGRNYFSSSKNGVAILKDFHRLRDRSKEEFGDFSMRSTKFPDKFWTMVVKFIRYEGFHDQIGPYESGRGCGGWYLNHVGGKGVN